MPVRKLRSIEDMPGPVWRQPGDPALCRTIAQLWDLGRRMTRHRYRPGVWRFRPVEEMDRAQKSEPRDRLG